MNRGGSGALITVGLSAGFISVVSLVLPWFDVLGRERSSIDMLRSASALDVLDGSARLAVIAAWLLMPLLLTVAIFLAAASRYRLAAAILLPIGLLTIAVAAVGLLVDDIGLAWGALVGAACALAASALAIMVLLGSNSPTPSGGNT